MIMRIDYIYIDGYKNLSALEIFTGTQSPMIGLIGNNGSGKSNILEALTIIFSKVRVSIPVEFSYCIKYSIEDNKYELSNLEGTTIVKCNDKKMLKGKQGSALPSTIFLYYCGETARLKEFSLNYVDKEFEYVLKRGNESAIKYLSYITVEDFGAALLANVAFDNRTSEKVFEIVNIDSINFPVIIKLKKPTTWGKSGKAENRWNAIGAVRTEIEKLEAISEDVKIPPSGDSVEIKINNLAQFKEKWFSASNLFISFKMLAQAEILDKIEFNVTKKGGAHSFSYMDLSEGEKQLSQLLSLIEITKDHRELFLLDEFDSYLHPTWQRKFADILRDIDIKGQILFTSHSPLTLSKMKKEDIIILKDGKSYHPAADTFNRDVSEVLEETMEVGMRPKEIEELIMKFRNAAVHSQKENALRFLDELKGQLSPDDPFFITASHLLAHIR